MTTMDPHRSIWEERWRDTVWERRANDGSWSPLTNDGAAPQVALSAWNPGSMRLPLAVNQARDALLQAELVVRGTLPQRIRGRSSDGSWWEDGWLIDHQPERTEALLRRHGQLAGLVIEQGAMRYHWSQAYPLAT